METQLEWDLLVKLTSLSGSSKAQCSCDTIGRSEITWAGLFGRPCDIHLWRRDASTPIRRSASRGIATGRQWKLYHVDSTTITPHLAQDLTSQQTQCKPQVWMPSAATTRSLHATRPLNDIALERRLAGFGHHRQDPFRKMLT